MGRRDRMAIVVRIPGPLKSLTEGTADLEMEAKDVAECLSKLGEQFPKLNERMWDEEGQMHRHINVYVNGEDVRFLQQLSTPLNPGDELAIVPAMAGG
jgi:molybdopterin synthase sulfur carrier subunit